eukprot:scaffold180100_cov21-Tisochrysis_lutea.AAC.1
MPIPARHTSHVEPRPAWSHLWAEEGGVASVPRQARQRGGKEAPFGASPANGWGGRGASAAGVEIEISTPPSERQRRDRKLDARPAVAITHSLTGLGQFLSHPPRWETRIR